MIGATFSLNERDFTYEDLFVYLLRAITTFQKHLSSTVLSILKIKYKIGEYFCEIFYILRYNLPNNIPNFNGDRLSLGFPI